MLFFDGYGEIQKKQTSVAIQSEKMLFLQHEISKTALVGSDTQEGYGDYFAWGETEPKSTYDWGTYKWCNGDYDQLNKYCSDSDYGYNGFTDNLTILQPSDDAATSNWGIGWCTPTETQWRELYQNTTNSWTIQNGVNGSLFTASNGRSLFLPAAGYHSENGLDHENSYGYYWSSLLDTSIPNAVWVFDCFWPPDKCRPAPGETACRAL